MQEAKRLLLAVSVVDSMIYERPVRCHTMETKHFDQNMAVNCRGVWLCCKYALAQMMEQEPREPNARGERTRGWIINAASITG